MYINSNNILMRTITATSYSKSGKLHAMMFDLTYIVILHRCMPPSLVVRNNQILYLLITHLCFVRIFLLCIDAFVHHYVLESGVHSSTLTSVIAKVTRTVYQVLFAE